MKKGPMRGLTKRDDELISASEVAAFAFCPEQWRLEYGRGLPANNQAARKAGTRHHGRKALAEWLAGGWIALGRSLVVLAPLLLVLRILWLVWR
jgi:hypothetical protein